MAQAKSQYVHQLMIHVGDMEINQLKLALQCRAS